jgi:cytochrome b561
MEKYSNLQIWLHWIVFVLIISQYLFHEPIAEAFDLRLEGKDFAQSVLIPLHLVCGGVIFLLAVMRLWIRVTEGVPPYPKEGAALMKYMSMVVHWSFYGFLMLLPITGGAAWFQLSEGAGNAHEILRGLLIAFILLHVSASIFHYIALKTNLFWRMWWG